MTESILETSSVRFHQKLAEQVVDTPWHVELIYLSIKKRNLLNDSTMNSKAN